MHTRSLNCGLAAGALCAILGYPLSAAAAQADPITISTPPRSARPNALPAPTPPAALPAAALSLEPLTIHIVRGTHGPASPDTPSEQVTRTTDRIHVRVSPMREWLYVRNPVDARRVSAVMIDHAQRVLVSYEESELRNTRGIRGWLDVLALGLDVSAFPPAESTSETRTTFGMTFRRYSGRTDMAARTELWWNQSEFVPLELATEQADGTRSVWLSVRNVRRTIERGVLEPPATRFPAYREVGYADWLEGLGH